MKWQWRILLVAFPLAGALLGYLAAPAFARLRLEVRRGDLDWERIVAAPDDETNDELAVRRQAIPREEVAGQARRARRGFPVGGALFGLWSGLVVSARIWRLHRTPERLEFEAHHGDCVACARCFLSCPRERLRRRPQGEKARPPARPAFGRAEPWAPKGRHLQAASASVGVAAAIFCAIVAAFLVAEALAVWPAKPPEDPALESLLARYEAGESDEALLEEIRAADVRRRHDMLLRQRFFQRGAWLLLVGGIVAVGAFSAWSGLRPKEIAVPDLDPEAKDNEAKERRAGAVGAAVLGGLLLAALLGLALWGRALEAAGREAGRVAEDGAPMETER